MRIPEEKHDVSAALFMVTLKGQAGPLQPFPPATRCPLTSGGRMEVVGGDSGSGGGTPAGRPQRPLLAERAKIGRRG